MPQPGTQLLHYRIVDKLGEGGMGQVWRAVDTNLDRQVAIKILPEVFSQDPERLARFEREAKLLASLNHPHIATVHGLHEQPGEGSTPSLRFLAMELVDGEDLAARLLRGPLPMDEALAVCRQVAAALEAAHSKGVVHRDLKPANVVLTSDGQAKVLDFGLAKAAKPDAASASGSSSLSPTVTSAGTVAGVLLGTAAYMSPEQARGKPVDRRTDLWALGCVIYECLTGMQLFKGETISDSLAAVLRKEPDWSKLPPNTPPLVRLLLQRCLTRDPSKRLQDAGDARIELERAIEDPRPEALGLAPATGEPAAAARSSLLARSGWIVAALLAASMIALVLRPANEDATAEIMRFTVSRASGAIHDTRAGNSAISPDGRTIVFAGLDTEGHRGLWIQPLDEIAARFLPGTEGASYPFWSPDSERVGFFADGKLKRVALDGGRVEVLCDASTGRGGTWSRNGVIVFSPAVSDPLWQVDATGGTPTPLTRVDLDQGEIGHRFPDFLPDAEHYIYLAEAGSDESAPVYLGRLGTEERQLLMHTLRAPIYAEPGYLIFAEDERLVAQRLDLSAGRLTGDPIRLAEQEPLAKNTFDRVASASDNGVLMLPSPEQQTILAWLDRKGRRVDELPLPPGRFSAVRVSPDGKRVAMHGPDDVWVADIERSTTTRVTFAPKTDQYPVWSPDGRYLAFQSNRNGPRDIFSKPFDGSDDTQPIFTSQTVWKSATSWSAGWIVFEIVDPETGYDIWIVSADDPGTARPYLATQAQEARARVSPDGRWLAYASNESGRFEVYVQSFPEPGAKVQVTTDGGGSPLWSADGAKLFCHTSDGALSAVPVTSGRRLTFGAVQPLFPSPGAFDIDVASDGRFAVIVPEDPAAQTLIVVVNWAAQLKR